MSVNQFKNEEYVLGTGVDELARLEQQHQAWANYTNAAWDRAAIGPGARVLDLGCGPGFTSLELAERVTPTGFVVAVDESPSFLQYLKDRAEKSGIKQIKAISADVMDLSSALGDGEKFDVVYCRWVLCWLKDPARAIRNVKSVLKPGGRFLIHDYFNWRSMGVAPRSSAVDKMVLAAVKSFSDHDGNVDIAADLPRLLRAEGFEVPTLTCEQRIAIGGSSDPALRWVLNWWRTYGPKLVRGGYLESKTYAEAAKDLDKLEADKNQFFFCPPLFEFLAKVK